MAGNRHTDDHTFKRLSGKQIGVRLPETIAARLTALARAENNGLSAVVRRLLTTGLAAEERRSGR